MRPVPIVLPTLLLLLLCALSVACEGAIGGSDLDPMPLPIPENVGQTGGGIRLIPPDGVGARALNCEEDHAPLRRLSAVEYEHTLADLFDGYTLPALEVATEARRSGFTNNFLGQAPTASYVASVQTNAFIVAAALAEEVGAAMGCGDSADCYAEFLYAFGRRAYRRPLTDDEHGRLFSFYDGAAGGRFDLAVEMALASMLQAPAFLYRPEFGLSGALSPHEAASRLSYFLWASMPDEALLQAADDDALVGSDLEMQVDRMLADPRAERGLVRALGEWFEVDLLQGALKSADYDFDENVRAALRESFERTAWENGFAEGSSIDALFTDGGVYVSTETAHVFGVDSGAVSEVPRRIAREDRFGILTHPAILAVQAWGSYPSPVQRGVFIRADVLCDPPRPPPNVEFSEPERETASGDPLTNREGYERLTESETLCRNCHQSINPYGFAFENYDTDGSFRATDNGNMVDPSGQVGAFSFDGPADLTRQFADSARVRACLVDRWVRFATGGGALAYDPCLREKLEEVARAPGASMRDIVIAIALDPKFITADIVPLEAE